MGVRSNIFFIQGLVCLLDARMVYFHTLKTKNRPLLLWFGFLWKKMTSSLGSLFFTLLTQTAALNCMNTITANVGKPALKCPTKEIQNFAKRLPYLLNSTTVCRS